MRVGIIAEGRFDVAVVQNILKGALGLDREFTQPLRPELYADETDLHADPDRFSNWALVKRECEDGAKIDDFTGSPIDDGPRFVVVHIDAAESPLYGVDRPQDRAGEDITALIARIRGTVTGWLGERDGHVCPAIAVEETDACVLALHVKDGTTDRLPNVKERLQRRLQEVLQGTRERQILRDQDSHRRGLELSRDLRRRKALERCCARSESLRAFVAALDTRSDR